MTNIPSPADPDARIRVAIADDQQLVRSGFGMLLSSQPDMAVVGEAGTGQEAIALVERVLVDVILMDVRMPGMDGLAATQAIVEQARASGCHQRPRVIILTTFALDEYVFQAIEAGASGFLLKDADPEELLQAVRTVHRGDAVIAPQMTRRLLDALMPTRQVAAPALSNRQREMLESLTRREREVLGLLAQGRSNAEIAGELFLSETTVKTHVAHILQKTASRDRVQAVVFAYETGVVGANTGDGSAPE
ncbi:MAG TPA: response regulator transcription factor [Pseudoclavibacter sp.]|nr:response regulator transcription factor [Pseudoclavibacter sp.]